MSTQPMVNPAFSSKNHVARASVRTIARAFWHRFTLAWQIRSERCMLANLSDEALRDMGIERNEAKSESSRRLFDLPENRD